MPMPLKEHEALITELHDLPADNYTRRGEILTLLRGDYANVHQDYEKQTNSLLQLQDEVADLQTWNSKLFRGQGQSEDFKKLETEQEFSKTVNLNDILGGI